ncbi:hypothetical protein ACJJTC_012846 [Scirpophaga incertulas]
MPRQRGSVLKRQARKMVYDVFQYFLKDHNITEAQKKTAEATKTSISTLKRILRDAKSSEFMVVSRTPEKKKRAKPITDVDFDKGVIRRCIHNFHITEKELPTLGKLREKLRADINFQGCARTGYTTQFIGGHFVANIGHTRYGLPERRPEYTHTRTGTPYGVTRKNRFSILLRSPAQVQKTAQVYSHTHSGLPAQGYVTEIEDLRAQLMEANALYEATRRRQVTRTRHDSMTDPCAILDDAKRELDKVNL